MFMTWQDVNCYIEWLLKTIHFFFSSASLVCLTYLAYSQPQMKNFFIVKKNTHNTPFCSFPSDIRTKSASDAHLPTNNNKIKTMTLPLIIFCRSFRRHWYQICFSSTNASQNDEQLLAYLVINRMSLIFQSVKELMA